MEYLHDSSSTLNDKIQGIKRIQMEHGGPSLVEYLAGNKTIFGWGRLNGLKSSVCLLKRLHKCLHNRLHGYL